MKKTLVLALVLVVALAGIGLGYAHWTDQLLVVGTVETGFLDKTLISVFTDDDNEVFDPVLDGEDDGECSLFQMGPYNSCDPAAPLACSLDPFVPPPGYIRYDKGVAACIVTDVDLDENIITFEILNGYPSYWCTLWFGIENSGTIPWMLTELDGLVLSDPLAIEAYVLGTPCGTQVDPGEAVMRGIAVHVLQEAEQGATYSIAFNEGMVNWNEFEPGMCP